ncbi:YbhB/YbcL family Raf kinase inhibitor-like protein [Nocardia brasiliensis]|uniref:YbhB/YbcL family Raf kinase inhibitor-like protein n=1 Tax=Nocardia brasiliensis TaxID=37326 RepID=UPI001895F680|nr:YbhB/YbcL family Raf kinase inhibitor-like protein [Nocardia brasiliensis]MBF6129606.1 YbhB/YbcL family Raf kinase inhibitor-like protein [Nocardia brasiliensis]
MSSNNPFARLPEAAAFTVTSTTVADGAAWSPEQFSAGVPGGKDVSPHLRWSGAPSGTKSYAVTVYDPDAPTGSGFWHWAVADIPATVTELPAGAGDDTVPADATPAYLGFTIAGHILGRAVLTATAETVAA